MRERTNTSALRVALEEMTHQDDVLRHPALLAALTRECPNTVSLLNSMHPIRRYTCVMHVFSFTENPDYAAIATSGQGKIFAAGDFVHWLLDHNHLVEVAWSEAREGDIALYFSEAADSSMPVERLKMAGSRRSGAEDTFTNTTLRCRSLTETTCDSSVDFPAKRLLSTSFALRKKRCEGLGGFFSRSDTFNVIALGTLLVVPDEGELDPVHVGDFLCFRFDRLVLHRLRIHLKHHVVKRGP